MPAVLAQVMMFASSFSPLLIVFSLLESFGKGIWSWICFGIAGVSIAGLVLVMRSAGNLATNTVEVLRSKHRDSEAIGYVVTYLLPFTQLGTGGWRGKLAVGIFVVVVAALYLRSHMFYVNPLLSLAGYRLFEVEVASGRSFVLISKRKYIAPRSELRVRTLSDFVFLEEPSVVQSGTG